MLLNGRGPCRDVDRGRSRARLAVLLTLKDVRYDRASILLGEHTHYSAKTSLHSSGESYMSAGSKAQHAHYGQEPRLESPAGHRGNTNKQCQRNVASLL